MSQEPGFRPRHYAARDGLLLFFRDYGPPCGPRIPLLCLPGLSRNSRDFHELALRLAGTRRVIAPDYRGRGDSAWPKDPASYAPEQVLDDLSQLLAILDCKQVILLGTSFGGLMAMALAVAHPSRLSGLILNDAAPEIDRGSSEDILRRIEDPRPQPDFESALAHVKEKFAEVRLRDERQWRALAESCYRQGEDGRYHVTWDPRIAQVIRRRIGPPEELWRLFRATRPFPLLVLRGGASPLVQEETLERMAAVKPDTMFCNVPGLGRPPSLEEWEAREAIDEFLRHCDPEQRAPSA